ncbi:MAG: DNA primase [Thermoguttaceae bacterium]|nr:DNA primase [Thermoguttaceae bacterium]MDW8077956.1 DNA primase [Thermoguttaceae bacterium]
MTRPDFQHIKERIKQTIDIVDLVGRYIPLRRQGRLFVGLCPWHDDTHPSLQVDPQRQTFRCWVCNIGGDIFSFLMRIEGLEFREAFKSLAEMAGVSWHPGPSGGPRAGAQAQLPSKSALLEVLAWAERKYHERLLTDLEAAPVRQYLADRGISAESIERFRLGFSPPAPEWIVREARRDRIEASHLIAAGIVARSSTGALYDRFSGRLLFPIHDPQNRPVSFGGRILPDAYGIKPGIPFGAQAKYVNGPETPVFSKSRMLYGLAQAWQAVYRNQCALVVEGYTDCILAHQFGFSEAVAVLGTAFGEGHLRLLRRYSNRVILLLDGDEAGRKRASELLELFLASDVDLRVVILPEDKDPADFLLTEGSEALRQLINSSSVDAFEHARRVYVGETPPAGLAASDWALERLLRVVAACPAFRSEENRLREGLLLQRLAFEFGIGEEVLRRRLAELRRGTPVRKKEPAPSVSEIPAPWQRELLEILIVHPHLVPRAIQWVPPEGIEYRPYREIYQAMKVLTESGGSVTLESLLNYFEDPQIHSVLVAVDEEARKKTLEDPEGALRTFVNTYLIRSVDQQLPQVTRALASGELSESEQIALLERIVALRRSAGGLNHNAR